MTCYFLNISLSGPDEEKQERNEMGVHRAHICGEGVYCVRTLGASASESERSVRHELLSWELNTRKQWSAIMAGNSEPSHRCSCATTIGMHMSGGSSSSRISSHMCTALACN